MKTRQGWVFITSMLAALASHAAAAGPGIEAPMWQQIQPRIRLGMASTAPTPLSSPWAWAPAAAPAAPSALVMGDYFLNLRRLGLGDGFRASSGVLLRAPGVSLADLAVPTRGKVGSLGLANASALNLLADGSDASATQPYLGLGYTGRAIDGRFSFSADFGLLAQNSGNVIRLGRTLGGNRSLDDALRELRLTPLLQMGVRYSF